MDAHSFIHPLSADPDDLPQQGFRGAAPSTSPARWKLSYQMSKAEGGPLSVLMSFNVPTQVSPDVSSGT